jgi:hypothetical protein
MNIGDLTILGSGSDWFWTMLAMSGTAAASGWVTRWRGSQDARRIEA